MGAREGTRARLPARFWSFGPKELRSFNGENLSPGGPQAGRPAVLSRDSRSMLARRKPRSAIRPPYLAPQFFHASKFFQRVISYTRVTVVTGYVLGMTLCLN